MTSIKNRLTYSPVHYFLIKVGALCIAIQLVYYLFLLPSGRLDLFLCRSSAFMAAWWLSFLGWTTNSWETILAVKGFGGVEIINDCNGLTLMELYASFIFAYPGPLRIKIWFFFSGVFLIYLANVLHIMGFALANVYFPDHWDTFHEFSAFIFLYSITLGLWYLWTVKSGQNDILSPFRFS